MDWSKIWSASKTIIIGLVIALIPTALQYLGGVDWAQYVGPNAAVVIVSLITLLLKSPIVHK